MNLLLEYSVDPCFNKFRVLYDSKRTQTTLGEIYSSFETAVLLQNFDNPEYTEIITGKDKKELTDKYHVLNIEVTTKLVACPRVILLGKSWGLFFATGEIDYLRRAFETAGNSRSSETVKSTAIKLFQEAREYYDYLSPEADSKCIRSFREIEIDIARSEEVLKNLRHGRNQGGKQMRDADVTGLLEEIKTIRPGSKNKSGSSCGRGEIEKAEKIFDEIAAELFKVIT